ncbi:MAG TPA: VIT1/CCC1 transporter family protein, partial [Planctomycetaceae bacterium]|nr:VIT1/CCC1 transporter family protein [Planctomycetaceae bacterium]
SGSVDSTGVVVTAGLAEIVAGSIAMGLGGYLAAKTDLEHYGAEREREVRETQEVPDIETEEVASVFRGYGLTAAQVEPVVSAICADRDRWVDFMMRFELGLEPPDPSRAGKSAATIAGSYVVGGFIPLAPYMLVSSIQSALLVSVGVTLVALFLFGYIKARFTGIHPLRGAGQTITVGGLAAAAAFAIARMIG